MVINQLSEVELEELRRLMPSLRELSRNREYVEKILKLLIDERDSDKIDSHEIQNSLQTLEQLERIFPTLVKLAENKERVDWFWNVARKWGSGALALVILVSTFQEHVMKLAIWVRAWFGK